jgi:6-phosphogluconate dehydrogenase
MPGGHHEAWAAIKPIFQVIAAKVDDGSPCCDWVGSDGAGHFVKMVHNGIEYSDMQLICEAYHLMSTGLDLDHQAMHKIFDKWNHGHLSSYLIEITRDIMLVTDEVTKQPVLDLILDSAGQKGTGKWTSVSALDLGVPVPQIAEAVFARCISSLKDERVAAAKLLIGPSHLYFDDKPTFITYLHDALLASKICSYAQGFQLLSNSAAEYKWELNLGSIALMWREGCIIRAGFLQKIKDAYSLNSKLPNLMIDPFFTELLKNAQTGWRHVVKTAIDIGIPLPSMSSALSYYDSYRSSRLAANLLQAQRDYFGAHTYERIDHPRGKFFHTDWTGHGGKTASTTYNA